MRKQLLEDPEEELLSPLCGVMKKFVLLADRPEVLEEQLLQNAVLLLALLDNLLLEHALLGHHTLIYEGLCHRAARELKLLVVEQVGQLCGRQ